MFKSKISAMVMVFLAVTGAQIVAHAQVHPSFITPNPSEDERAALAAMIVPSQILQAEEASGRYLVDGQVSGGRRFLEEGGYFMAYGPELVEIVRTTMYNTPENWLTFRPTRHTIYSNAFEGIEILVVAEPNSGLSYQGSIVLRSASVRPTSVYEGYDLAEKKSAAFIRRIESSFGYGSFMAVSVLNFYLERSGFYNGQLRGETHEVTLTFQKGDSIEQTASRLEALLSSLPR